MPVYLIKHSCGYEGEQFLRDNKETKTLKCPRCGRGATARQVRDGLKQVENNEVIGYVRP